MVAGLHRPARRPGHGCAWHRHLRAQPADQRCGDPDPALQHRSGGKHAHLSEHQRYGDSPWRRRGLGAGGVGGLLGAGGRARFRSRPQERTGWKRQPAGDALRQRGFEEHHLFADLPRRTRRHAPGCGDPVRRPGRVFAVAGLRRLRHGRGRGERRAQQYRGDQWVRGAADLPHRPDPRHPGERTDGERGRTDQRRLHDHAHRRHRGGIDGPLFGGRHGHARYRLHHAQRQRDHGRGPADRDDRRRAHRRRRGRGR